MKFQSKYVFEELAGKKINYLTPVSISDSLAKDGSIQWNFKCVCGRVISQSPSRVFSEHVKSCGCMRYKTPQQLSKRSSTRPPARIDPSDYIGQKRNRLTVIGFERPAVKGRLKLICRCDCGSETSIYPYQFSSGSVLSCGCARLGHSDCHKGNTSRRTHNLSTNKFYKKWNDMVRRCHNPNEPAYSRYGAQGITVCDEWRNSPDKFIEWCDATHPDGPMLSIDRIDGAKGYSPDNCRWIPQSKQVYNIKSNKWVTLFGEKKCVTTWCKELHISPGSIYARVKKGMTFEEAFEDFFARRISK